ncbi:UNVERIFIED_CONTAM: hypothetical protein FKN15_029808 [Acipenser sinensis]
MCPCVQFGSDAGGMEKGKRSTNRIAWCRDMSASPLVSHWISTANNVPLCPIRVRCWGHGKGKEIDQSDCVVRMNNAPTLGYEDDVGSKTSLRVISHTSVPLLLRNETRFFRQEADTVYVVWGPERNMRQDGKGRVYNALVKVTEKYPDAHIYMLTREKMLECDAIFQNETGKDRIKSGSFLSTGFFTMILALGMCDSIQVYGMINDNYCSRANHNTVPYHYYENGRLDECQMYRAHEKAARGGHRFITEKAIFAKWATRKNLTFSNPSWAESNTV